MKKFLLSKTETKFCLSIKHSTYQKRLIEHSFKHSRGFGENYFLSEMITWQTLRILKLMLDSTDFCKTYGLGCQLSKNNSKPKCLVLITILKKKEVQFSIKISKVSKK